MGAVDGRQSQIQNLQLQERKYLQKVRKQKSTESTRTTSKEMELVTCISGIGMRTDREGEEERETQCIIGKPSAV